MTSGFFHNSALDAKSDIERVKALIKGVVQGVGFRPLVFRLATDLVLFGSVKNTCHGVCIDIEGTKEKIDIFFKNLNKKAVSPISISSIDRSSEPLLGYKVFSIEKSTDEHSHSSALSPDLAICGECIADISDSRNRRHRYPFTTCSACGPRFSIVESLPYDRDNTSMRAFQMCAQCREEFENPSNRRFHAQTNACSACGPELKLLDSSGKLLLCGDAALSATVNYIKKGHIVALKGLGGFQLLADATSDQAVSILRERKQRKSKPFAVMFPSLSELKRHCLTSIYEENVLVGRQAPIVLVRKKAANIFGLSAFVAPENPFLGAMLPYTPLHYLLCNELGIPIIATSGNQSDEPICIDNAEALEQLSNIADLFLVHDRAIIHHVDDSIVQFIDKQPQVIRLARGFIPLSVPREKTGEFALATGGHLKNAVVMALHDEIIVSQYIGSLDTGKSRDVFSKVVRNLENIYRAAPKTIIHDLHPDYFSTSTFTSRPAAKISVQHHIGHAFSCFCEHKLSFPALAISWDGTGYGTDQTVWGAEFFLLRDSEVRRVGSFKPFMLPGGERAVYEPRRSAIGLLYEIFGKDVLGFKTLPSIQSFTGEELSLLEQMLEKKINSPYCSSMGRLFDGVSSLLGLVQKSDYEAEAAIRLESISQLSTLNKSYDFKFSYANVGGENILTADWGFLIRSILEDIGNGKPQCDISLKFHHTLATIACRVAEVFGIEQIILSGGCFQNRTLCQLVKKCLEAKNFRPFFNQLIPTNDNGLAFGQMAYYEKYLSQQ